MAKKNTAIYEPGELNRVRDNLGVKDVEEAKKMAQILGGEIGTEKSAEVDSFLNRKNSFVGGKKRSRKVDVASASTEEENTGGWFNKPKRIGPYPGDDPSVPARLSYAERVKIDQYAGQLIFEIKTSMQVLVSFFSFFREPVDFVNPRFVTVRMSEYFSKIEKLVNATRSLFPKNNTRRNNQLRRTSLLVYKILDTIRSWDIETISQNIAVLQSQPRTSRVADFADVMRGMLRPLFILEELNMENIKSSFKLIYKILYIESPMEAKEKYQDIIRNIISSLADVRKNVIFGLYPLIMKLISDRFLDYERFFIERRRRYMAFLNVTEADQLNAVDLNPTQIESIDVETLQKNTDEDDENLGEGETREEKEEDPNDPKVIERKARENAEKAQQKALEQGRVILGFLFPKAGWDKLEEFPDLHPYFANIYNMRYGYELISPADPVQQVSVLMNILDDLFIGLRYVDFGITIGPDGNPVKLTEELGELINNWRGCIEDSFSRDYLPRLSEYCRMLENSRDSKMSPYAKKSLNELHWIKRLYFFPYYKFESIGPPPFPRKDVVAVYSEVRKLRKYLTAVAMGIEQGLRNGGAAAKAPCNGINNPWLAYNFQVPNPVSKRMDLIFPPEKKINATLIFFSLSIVSVLDHIVNNENSWAYGTRPGPLFRSLNNEGVIPLFGVDEKLDADKIFRDSLKKANS